MTGSADTSRAFAASEFDHLLKHLVTRDYAVVDCLAQNREQARRTISFRYDVHLRDVHCAHGFLDVHRQRRVPGTFFLLHGYAATERAHEQDFVALAEAVRAAQGEGVPVQLGLHDSPVDRYLIATVADGDEGRFMAWLRNYECVEYFRRLSESPAAAAEFNANVLALFVESVRSARAAFGDFQLSAGHGGKLAQLLRPRLAALEGLAPIISACFSENWLTLERLSAAGLVGDMELFKRGTPGVAYITEGGGKLTVMCERLHHYMRVERPITALIHPATWGRPARDSEWSALLDAPTVRLALSANAATFARDFPELDGIEVAALAEGNVPESGQASEPLSRVVDVRPLMTLLAARLANPAAYDVRVGESLQRYGELVRASLAAAFGRSPEVEPELARRATALGEWLRQETRPIGKPRLSTGELQYFLFSSSQRALSLARALQHFVAPHFARQGLRFVDHGAGIAFMPLIVDGFVRVSAVNCSEIKPQFIDAGRALWAALGMGERLSYDAGSVLEFPYEQPVNVVVFGHMLYRVPPDRRREALQRASAALLPGGMLLINELMNRPDLDKTYEYPCLTSRELLGYLDPDLDAFAVDVKGASVDDAPAASYDEAFFKRSDNIVVALKRA
ncbi:MAG TPA: class I SAM-dependent methyltransferase [Polyangiaceae bacterium]|nr:class I SAM-dependent methyltransferase [Polyangiaceae bacterium]